MELWLEDQFCQPTCKILYKRTMNKARELPMNKTQILYHGTIQSTYTRPRQQRGDWATK